MKWALLVLLSQAVEAPKVPVLLQPGEYHGNEVEAKHGERWLGLVPEGKGYRWKEVRLRVEPHYDAIVDEAGKKTGKKVSVAGPQPVVMVPLSFGLEKARVSKANLPVEFDAAAGRAYRLECRECKSPTVIVWEGEASRLRLVVRRGGQAQQLFQIANPDDPPIGLLLWAGDVDGDGQVDLLINASEHYNMTRPTLYLSSKAKRGELLGLAAQHTSFGC